MKKYHLLFLLLFLQACAPKYQFIHQANQGQQIQHIDVVMDYVHFVDDVGKLLDYDEAINQKDLQVLKDKVRTMLKSKGYDSVSFVSISSGVTLDMTIDFELYQNRKFQEKIINPPFYMAAEGITTEEQDHLLGTMRQFFQTAMVPVKDETLGFLRQLAIPAKPYERQDADKRAILIVQVTYPRVSFMKSFGMTLATGLVSGGITGGSMITTATPYGIPFSHALLFDFEQGGLIWKNHKQAAMNKMGKQSLNSYFKDFPERR